MANEIIIAVYATIKIKRKPEVVRRIDLVETGQKLNMEQARSLAKSLQDDLETEYPEWSESWRSVVYDNDFTRRDKLQASLDAKRV